MNRQVNCQFAYPRYWQTNMDAWHKIVVGYNDTQPFSWMFIGMVTLQPQALDRVFLALGHPIRRQILVRLAQGTATVTDIAEPFDLSLNAISKHLKVLEKAGLIQREVLGREHCN